MQRPSEQELWCYAPCFALPGKAAAESWWSHHSSNDNDVMTQMAGAEEEMGMPCSGKCRARGPIARLLAADQQGSIIINGQQSPRGARDSDTLFDLRRQFRAGPARRAWAGRETTDERD